MALTPILPVASLDAVALLAPMRYNKYVDAIEIYTHLLWTIAGASGIIL